MRTLVKYFYSQAQQQAAPGEEVNEGDFRYPGPNPRTKETAILDVGRYLRGGRAGGAPGHARGIWNLWSIG